MTQEHNAEMPDAITETTDEPVGYPVWLTAKEVLFIDDNLHLMIEAPRGQHGAHVTTIRPLARQPGIPAVSEMIEKIGHAVLNITDCDNAARPTRVDFDATELLVIREIALSDIKIGDEPVGLNLKKKVYGALWGEAYRTDKISRDLLSRAGLLVDPDSSE